MGASLPVSHEGLTIGLDRRDTTLHGDLLVRHSGSRRAIRHIGEQEPWGRVNDRGRFHADRAADPGSVTLGTRGPVAKIDPAPGREPVELAQPALLTQPLHGLPRIVGQHAD